jgi:diacylglycerol kinase
MLERVADSLRGLEAGWRRERSVRAHVLLSAVGVGVLAFCQPGAVWFLAFATLLVVGLAVELMNAAIEALLDRLHPDLHPAIGAAKDMSSAAGFVIDIAATATFSAALLS